MAKVNIQLGKVKHEKVSTNVSKIKALWLVKKKTQRLQVEGNIQLFS